MRNNYDIYLAIIETLPSRNFRSGAIKKFISKIKAILLISRDTSGTFFTPVFHSMRETTDISLHPHHNAKLPTTSYALRLQSPYKTIGQWRVFVLTPGINIHLYCRAYRNEACNNRKKIPPRKFMYNEIKKLLQEKNSSSFSLE